MTKEEEMTAREVAKTINNAIRKQIPKKPICIKDSATTKHFTCPVCAYRFVSEIDGQLCAGRKARFCPDCGQAIDWRAGNGET